MMTMLTGGGITPMVYTPPDTLTILSISVDSNGANLAVGYASNSLIGFHHFIMATSDLLLTNWVPLGNDMDIAGANPYFWTDTTANETNENMNSCRAMTLDSLDPPGGGGTNTWTNTTTIARFYRALAVDPSADSNSDGLPDWWELKYFGSFTGATAYGGPSGDPNNDNVNMLTDFTLGRNPWAGTVSDTSNQVALVVYTPM